MKKCLSTKKGSTLVMILIVFSILSILGVTIMSLGVMNFKMKTVDRRVKTAFYLAEAGQDEVYAIVINEIKEAIEEGYAVVDENLANWEVDPGNPISPPLNDWFQQGYKFHIQNQLADVIEDYSYSVLDVSIKDSPPTVVVQQTTSFQSSGENKLIIKVKSSFILDKVTESLVVEYKIAVPSYSRTLIKKEKIVPLIEVKYLDIT